MLDQASEIQEQPLNHVEEARFSPEVRVAAPETGLLAQHLDRGLPAQVAAEGPERGSSGEGAAEVARGQSQRMKT